MRGTLYRKSGVKVNKKIQKQRDLKKKFYNLDGTPPFGVKISKFGAAKEKRMRQAP